MQKEINISSDFSKRLNAVTHARHSAQCPAQCKSSEYAIPYYHQRYYFIPSPLHSFLAGCGCNQQIKSKNRLVRKHIQFLHFILTKRLDFRVKVVLNL